MATVMVSVRMKAVINMSTNRCTSGTATQSAPGSSEAWGRVAIDAIAKMQTFMMNRPV